ncbi:MAG: filamentous hemagglutinin, partial [Rivularia sp. (in: cyanobacteria)]
VTVDQLNVNPASGLIELPSTLVGTTGIKAGCAASEGNNFVVSGKGGLPQSPDDLFSGKTTVTELFDLVPTEESSSNIRNENSNVNLDNQKNKIVEATGWIKDSDGNVIFVAKMPDNNSQSSVHSSVDCESFSAEN